MSAVFVGSGSSVGAGCVVGTVVSGGLVAAVFAERDEINQMAAGTKTHTRIATAFHFWDAPDFVVGATA
jgi:hypothetical protein